MTEPQPATTLAAISLPTVTAMVHSLADALPHRPDATAEVRAVRHEAAALAIAGLQPRDPTEGMLAVRIIVSHYASIDCFRCAADHDLPPALRLRYSGRAIQLAALSQAADKELARRQSHPPQPSIPVLPRPAPQAAPARHSATPAGQPGAARPEQGTPPARQPGSAQPAQPGGASPGQGTPHPAAAGATTGAAPTPATAPATAPKPAAPMPALNRRQEDVAARLCPGLPVLPRATRAYPVLPRDTVSAPLLAERERLVDEILRNATRPAASRAA